MELEPPSFVATNAAQRIFQVVLVQHSVLLKLVSMVLNLNVKTLVHIATIESAHISISADKPRQYQSWCCPGMVV